MGQILTPDNIPDLVIASSTTITMAASYLGRDTRITIGGQQFKYASLTTLNFATAGFNGLDTGSIATNTLYYIYAVKSSGVPGLVASLNAPATGPSGFASWKEVGRCNTLVGSAALSSIINIGGNATASGFGFVAPRKSEFAITCSGSVALSSYFCFGIYYQDQSGSHRLKFNFSGVVAAGARTGIQITLTGITFRNVVNYYQGCSASVGNGSTAASAYGNPGNSIVSVEHASVSTTLYIVEGDTKLESRPSWA